MAISVTHPYVAVGADDPSKEVNAPQWNAAHTVSMATARLLGRTTASAGSAEEISVGTGLSFGSLSLSLDLTYTDGRYGLLGSANTWTGTQTARTAVGDGSSGIVGGGDPNTTGYVEFRTGAGTRLGYIGAADATAKILGFYGDNGGTWAIQASEISTIVSGSGYVTVKTGDSADTGYFEWRLASGQRLGYFGYAWQGDKVINLVTENGGSVKYNGDSFWTSGNLDKPVKVITLGAAPTTSDVPSGEARVVKRTDDGSVKLQYNDGGTLKGVTLT